MRKTLKLMKDWVFRDRNGREYLVELPHTWNAKDGQDGGNDYYRGTCCYRNRFPAPDFQKDRECVYLQFHGVNASARIFLNGKELYIHENGYSTFRFEITETLAAENELIVEVDNSRNQRVYPQVADFTFYGGIYRDVELLIINRQHFDLDYYGGPGLTVTPIFDEASGEGQIRTAVYYDSKTGEEELAALAAEVEFQLRDAEGQQIDAVRVPLVSRKTEAVFHLSKPHLWNGIDDPYLYEVNVLLYQGDTAADGVGCKCGIRSFRIDPNLGFFLNGRSYPLRGVSRHQDFRGIGNAISRQLMEQDMELIREVGANTIRLAHYQHDQYFYNLCDRYGMVVWAEIPYISAHMPEGNDNTIFQMKELITQNYNHPSIVVWGISNEITISGKHRKDMLENHKRLQAFCKEYDPTRLTTLACYAMCSPFHPVTKISDVVAWNLYLGWYVPGFFLNDLFMKFYHWCYPKRCLSYSEYGAEGMPNLHSERPKRGDHTEEYQAKYHEYMLNCFERHPFLWGTYVWNMFDFAADARDQGGEPGMNHKGLITFDRQTKKDSFYLYKAWWSREGFVHLCGSRFRYRTRRKTELVVYSNQPEVTLYQNGAEIETKRGERVFRFSVTLEQENEFAAKAGDYEDRIHLTLTDTARPEYRVKKGKSQNWV